MFGRNNLVFFVRFFGNKLWLIFFLGLFLLPFSRVDGAEVPFAEAVQQLNSNPIELGKNCWWYRQGFARDWTKLTPAQLKEAKNWQKASGLPLRIEKIYQGPAKETLTYSFVTSFDLSRYKKLRLATLALKVPFITENWQVYVNGKLLRSEMDLAPDGSIQTILKKRDVLLSFPGSLLKQKDNLVFIRVLGNSENSNLGLYFGEGYWITGLDYLREQNSEQIVLVLIFLYLFIGLYHLFLYTKRKQDRYNLFFALFAMGLFVYLFARADLVFELIPDATLVNRIEYMVLFALFPIFLGFLDQFFFYRFSLFFKIYMSFCLLLLIQIPFADKLYMHLLLRIWQFSALAAMVPTVVLFIIAIRRKKEGAYPLLAGFLLTIMAATFDILDSIYLDTRIAFTKYSFFVFVMGIVVILARRFLLVHRRAEELNHELERKVDERTLELESSLQQVQKLKSQQDGDYFLTSLILSPLGIIKGTSESVMVEAWEKQKKRFEFKHREGEIGGDLNIANRIMLQGREYLVFMNADAMGKSMQGAGGALVLGVVVNSYITRSQIGQDYQKKTPERWIKDLYYDLQNVFEAFDGSMLASLVMGMVDSETGALYYVNAEHPWSVLYRQGKASFVETQLELRKIGVPVNTGRFRVQSLMLQQGDHFIMGSDGRDDLDFGEDQDGNRIINEDENLFLHHVEQGMGQLPQIAEAIQGSGALTDDLTLLMVSFVGESSWDRYASKNLNSSQRGYLKEGIAAFRRSNYNRAVRSLQKLHGQEKNPLALYYLARIEMKRRRFAKAAALVQGYLAAFPLDGKMLYLASRALCKEGRVAQAIDYGERLYLLQPGFLANIVSLAECYRKKREYYRALSFLDEYLELGGSAQNISSLKQSIEEILAQGQTL